MLNLGKMSHMNKFVHSIEEQLKMHNAEQGLINMGNNPLHHEIEQLDKMITRILNTARNKVEGMRWNMLH